MSLYRLTKKIASWSCVGCHREHESYVGDIMVGPSQIYIGKCSCGQHNILLMVGDNGCRSDAARKRHIINQTLGKILYDAGQLAPVGVNSEEKCVVNLDNLALAVEIGDGTLEAPKVRGDR